MSVVMFIGIGELVHVKERRRGKICISAAVKQYSDADTQKG